MDERVGLCIKCMVRVELDAVLKAFKRNVSVDLGEKGLYDINKHELREIAQSG